MYLTLTELRLLLCNRSRSSIYRDIDAGRLPKPFKVGRVNYWDRADIAQAIQNLQGKPNSAPASDAASETEAPRKRARRSGAQKVDPSQKCPQTRDLFKGDGS